MIEAYQAVVVVPYVAALGLAALPGYRVGAIGNVIASAVTFAAGLWLLVGNQLIGDYAIVDEFNVVFVAINTLVGFTTALFSASYIGHEIETGRLMAYRIGKGALRIPHEAFEQYKVAITAAAATKRQAGVA